MTLENCVALFAIAPQRRGIETAFAHGLSLAVRFRSTMGEEIEMPAQSMTNPVRDGAELPYQDWSSNSAQPIVFRHGWPLSSKGRRAACAVPTPGRGAP